MEQEYDDPYWEYDSDSSIPYESFSRYRLGFCDLLHPYLHGVCNDEDDINESIYGHYLYVTETELENASNMIRMRESTFNYAARQIGGSQAMRHPIMRNYSNYATHYYHISPQILEIIEGPGNYSTAVIKTHYIRLLQRKWKSIYERRKKIIALRKNPKAMMYRELYGKWPNRCKKYI